jgi:Sulfotransferase domain
MVRPDDAFITSYPRSGNTWTRFLIANLMHPNGQVSFRNIESIIADASALSSKALKRIASPRLIKSHAYFDPRYRKVLYLVRDPRDVALSLYNIQRKYSLIRDKYPRERCIAERFIPGDLDLPWSEHGGSWLGARERLSRLPPGEIRRSAAGSAARACPRRCVHGCHGRHPGIDAGG